MKFRLAFSRLLLFLPILAGAPASVHAALLTIPNGSFESPATSFADPRIDSWQKFPKPAWYDESSGYSWDQLTGLFLNIPAGASNHIDNVDGSQALFLFNVPQVGIFQDYDSTSGTNSTPTHAFNAKFEAGKSYQLTVGLVGGGGNMPEGASLLVGLYYRDSASNIVNVAATNISYTRAAFTNTTHLVDYTVNVPTVKATDAWAGQNIGVQLMATATPDLVGGYWDLDNVRLAVNGGGPSLSGAVLSSGQFQFTLAGDPGLRFEVLATSNLGLPISSWTTLGTVTNSAGTVRFVDPAANVSERFYLARQLP